MWTSVCLIIQLVSRVENNSWINLQWVQEKSLKFIFFNLINKVFTFGITAKSIRCEACFFSSMINIIIHQLYAIVNKIYYWHRYKISTNQSIKKDLWQFVLDLLTERHILTKLIKFVYNYYQNVWFKCHIQDVL